MSKTSAIYHIVINTYCRKKTIPENHKRELYQYIFGIIKNKNCGLYRINGIGNHIHLLVELHPTVALATLMQNIKQSSSIWLKTNENFPLFEGWGKEYFAFTNSKAERNNVIEYIINQERHHERCSFEDEMKEICIAAGVEWHDNALS